MCAYRACQPTCIFHRAIIALNDIYPSARACDTDRLRTRRCSRSINLIESGYARAYVCMYNGAGKCAARGRVSPSRLLRDGVPIAAVYFSLSAECARELTRGELVIIDNGQADTGRERAEEKCIYI